MKRAFATFALNSSQRTTVAEVVINSSRAVERSVGRDHHNRIILRKLWDEVRGIGWEGLQSTSQVTLKCNVVEHHENQIIDFRQFPKKGILSANQSRHFSCIQVHKVLHMMGTRGLYCTTTLRDKWLSCGNLTCIWEEPEESERNSRKPANLSRPQWRVTHMSSSDHGG